VFALISCALLSMRTGGLNVLIPNPRDMDASVKEMAKYDFHFLPAVNTLFNGLLNNPEFAKLDFSHLCNLRSWISPICAIRPVAEWRFNLLWHRSGLR